MAVNVPTIINKIPLKETKHIGKIYLVNTDMEIKFQIISIKYVKYWRKGKKNKLQYAKYVFLFIQMLQILLFFENFKYMCITQKATTYRKKEYIIFKHFQRNQ